jgi:hypothetical protein
MQAKKKLCSGCNEPQFIWKSVGREKYCKRCWSCQSPSIVRQIEPKARTPLRPRSSKQQKLDVAYNALRIGHLSAHPMCEAHLENCTLRSTDIHHKAGRGEYLLDSTTFLAVCRTCHDWITLHSKEAIELGFSVLRLEKRKNLEE